MNCRDDAIKAIDEEWRSASDLHKRSGKLWSASAVRHALMALASEHKIEFRTVNIEIGSNVRFEYRLHAEKD